MGKISFHPVALGTYRLRGYIEFQKLIKIKDIREMLIFVYNWIQ